ncbi:MAG TPA: pitrilysin family protein [Cyclobacteriaceae bacterium]|jgi:predicted Zn-dependent peptidase|nr:insulinase family protein [Cytophagales bacterium]HRE66573.1 pitrilysin family protein [Cyclobacteriaceae bacterium]HRF31893.1 pitrilysin family protein [Cyclobacteriaceae bacterium]
MREHEIYTLKNGIRVIHNRVTTTKIVHCGIMLDIGSRDETPANQGIAHFWEHMAFKGTRKRKAFHIINRLESLGGELNAYTDKEKILFYASLRDDYFERAIELLTDITFDSVFPASQIEKERQVILEEMSMYFDDPDDSLQDEFDKVVFAGHSLGMNILGTEKSVRNFKRKNFQQFIREHLDTRRIVFSCVGNIPMEQVVKLAEKYLGAIPVLRSGKKRNPFKGYKPHEVVLKRPVKQSRCAIGRPAYSFTDPKRSPFYMLTSILGGSGMNSRLNLALREKHGFVYSIGAQYVPFTDTGLFAISFGTEPKQLKRSVALIKQELKKLTDSPLGIKQLASSKEQLLGQIAMAEENNISFMMMMARNILDQGRVTSLDEIFDRVRNTSAQQLQQLANEMFDEDKLSYLIMEPAHGVSA